MERVAYAHFPSEYFTESARPKGLRVSHFVTARERLAEFEQTQPSLTSDPISGKSHFAQRLRRMVDSNANLTAVSRAERPKVFFEDSLTPETPVSGEETYVLMPGLLYDGNRLTRAPLEIPQLAAPQNFPVDTPVFTLSIPIAAFFERRTGKTLMVLTEPSTALDMSGFSCVSREDDHRISVMAPCYREKHFHHNHYTPEAPKGAAVTEGSSFSVAVSYFAMRCPDVIGLSRRCNHTKNSASGV